jgi:hypothetical protein
MANQNILVLFLRRLVALPTSLAAGYPSMSPLSARRLSTCISVIGVDGWNSLLNPKKSLF